MTDPAVQEDADMPTKRQRRAQPRQGAAAPPGRLRVPAHRPAPSQPFRDRRRGCRGDLPADRRAAPRGRPGSVRGASARAAEALDDDAARLAAVGLVAPRSTGAAPGDRRSRRPRRGLREVFGFRRVLALRRALSRQRQCRRAAAARGAARVSAPPGLADPARGGAADPSPLRARQRGRVGPGDTQTKEPKET